MGKHKKTFNNFRKRTFIKRYNSNENAPLDVHNMNFGSVPQRAPFSSNMDQATKLPYDEYKSKSIVFDLINMTMLIGFLNRHLLCGICKKKGGLKFSATRRNGLACSFGMSCANCTLEGSFTNSEQRIYEANGKLRIRMHSSSMTTISSYI
jgi:hypothetical protein